MSDNKMTFEEAMKRLEEIVRFLESGNAPLDDSLKAFEEGVALVKLCNAELDNAEKKVKLLTFSDGEAYETQMPDLDVK